MEQIPEELKRYDTPENRRAYQSYKASQSVQVTDHGEVPQELWQFDTPENRREYQNYRMIKQANEGLLTSDNRLMQLSQDQIAWVTRQYQKSWDYNHDVLDQEAKANGALPPSMYSKYKQKSAYDMWAIQAGMPNEKELEKYLHGYDEWKVQYDADEKAYNDAMTKRKADEKLLDVFYNDVADRLYRAEFNGVQRGSEEWNKIFFDTLNEPKYESLKALNTDAAEAAPATELTMSDGRKISLTSDQIKYVTEAYRASWNYGHDEADLAAQEQGLMPPSLNSKYSKSSSYNTWALENNMPGESDLEKYLDKYDKDKATDPAASVPPTEEEIAAIVEDKGYYFPEVPDISFSINDFTSMYDRNVTAFEEEHGYGKINGAVRDAAAKIGYSAQQPVSIKGVAAEPVQISAAFGQKKVENDQVKVANQTDTASVCAGLASGGYNTDEYWAVVSGLMAGGPLDEKSYGPGLFFNDATQTKIMQYGQVVSTRYGSDLLRLIMNDASDNELQAYVQRAVESGATQELLTQAYQTAVTALGGTDEDDTSRNWDGLSYKERASKDDAFKKRFETAIAAAPSIPIGSGWSGKYQTKEDVDRIVTMRADFDLKDMYYDRYDYYDQSAADDARARLSAGEVELYTEGNDTITDHDVIYYAGHYTGKARFREDAKAHGYSDWEVDQFFRREGIKDRAPGETQEDYDRRLAGHYRQFLIETAGAVARDTDSGAPTPWGESAYRGGTSTRTSISGGTHGGHGGSFAPEDSDTASGGTHGGHGGSFDPVVSYFESISDSDLILAMKTDERTDEWSHAWIAAPAVIIARGANGFSSGVVNFFDMVTNGGTDGKTSEIAERLNRENQELAAIYKHNNQSPFVATVVDAGSELVRMYMVAKTGQVFGSAVTGSMGALGAESAVTWLSGGSKLATLAKWSIESVPFVTSAMGSSYAEARAEGATNQEAVRYGVLAGLVEGLTEKVSAELIIGEGGSKLVNGALGKVMKSGAKGLLKGIPGVLIVNGLKMGANAFIEAQQEGASYVLDLLLKRAIYDPDAQWSTDEFLSQMGMGALCGAMGLAFQNYGASYVQSMMEFATSSPENFNTFVDFATKMYGVNLGKDGNYTVKPSDFDASKILPASEWNAAWKDYLDASNVLASAQKQYEAAVASLNEDDAQKAREVMYWKNQIAAADPGDAKSATAMAHAMEQLTIAESKAADTAKKNQKLRQDARTELNNARRRAQNVMDETSAKIRAHSRAEIAATLGLGDTSLDSSYEALTSEVDVEAEQARLEQAQLYKTAVEDALSALSALERASEAQLTTRQALYGAAVSTLSGQYAADKPVIAGALDRVNQLAQEAEAQASALDTAADEMIANIETAKKQDQIRTAGFASELDTADSWYGATIDQIDAEMAEAERDARDGKITKEEYETKKEEAAGRIQTAMAVRDEMRAAAASDLAATGTTSTALEGLANAMRLEASEARAKAAEIRDAVVRALAYRTMDTALAAIDSITTGEGVLTVEQREALSDEMNQIVAAQLASDEATKVVYDAMEGLKLVEQQAEQKGAETSTQNASEAQESPIQSEQENAPATDEERQAELQKAVAVGKALGVDVQIVDDLPKELNGKYFDDGRILISSKATNAPMQVLVHELAHYMEGTAAYDQLQQYVFSTMAQDPEFNLSVEIAAYRTLYAQSRDAMGEAQLSDEDAIKEAKAEIVSRWCEKNLFTSEASINRLCSQETSLAKRILHGIQNMLSGKRRDPALAQLQTAEKLYIKALNQARAFGGAKINRNSVTSLLVGAGLYVDSDSNGFKVYRTRYNENGDRISIEELKPNLESPCDGPITTDDIMNHSPIGAFIRLGQQFGNIEGFSDSELEPGTNLRAIPSDRLSVGAKIVNLFTDLSNMCLAYGDNGMVWDFVGGYVFSSITSNSDPQYSRTVDYGTICRKTQNLITAMSEAMVQKGRGLYADEIIELSNELVQQGKLDVPCSMCYVFNRWLGLGGYLNRVKVYQDRYAAMTPDEAFKAFQDVQAQIDEVVGSRNFKTLINELCDQHGIDPKAYLKELAESNKAFRETGKFQATKKEMSKSDARTRAIQLYSKLLDDCEQSHDRKSLKDVDTTALMKDLETRRGVTDAYGWFTKVLLNENEDGTFSLKRSVLSEDGKSWATGADGNASFVVPTEILFNLNASDRFASEYPDVWRFRTAGGSALGKATYGYTDARLGEFTYGAAVANVKSQDVPKAPRWGVGGETSTAENQPKNKLSFVDSRGEFTTGGAATFAKAVQNILNQAWLGGDRMQSSSDYTSKHALDYLITAFEMQCLGAPVQTYTKVPEALAFFNAIGASANGSLIAKGNGVSGTPVYEFNEASGHYRVVEGSASLEISKVQGINPDDVRALVDASDNLQFIMVGMNREHTALTISTPWITMCIPVHMSGGTVDNISARAVAQGDPGLTKADINDATGCQNDKLLTEKELAATYKDNVDMVRLAREQRAAILSKNGNVDLNKIRMVDDWVSTKYPGNHRLLENMYETFQRSGAQLKVEFNEDGTPKGLGFGIYPNEYWDTTSTIDNAYVNGDRFLEYCWMLGVKPRFSYGEYGKHGSFPGLPKFEGYWKVLIDRPMYNADGSYRTVRPVDVSKLTAAMFTGEAATASGAKLYNADESAKLRQQEATASRVGGEYAGKITGTAADAMKAHSRNALAGDIDARLAELRAQYGAMPTSGTETAPGREDVVLPKQVTDDTYVRRAAQTFMRSPNVTDASASQIGRAVLRGEYNYERQTNEETKSRAEQRIIDLGGQQAALQYLKSVAAGNSKATAETVAIGEQLILDAQAVGDANAFEEAVAYTALIGTSAGQTVQAFSMINKLSPQGIALYMNRVIDRLNRVEYKDLIQKGKMKPIALTEEQTAKLLTVKSFSDATRVQTEILTEIAQQIPLTMKEQIRSWRYLCMLGNVRTNVRNIAGNLAMQGMRVGKDFVAAGLEALDVKRGERLQRKAAEASRAGDTAKAERLIEKAGKHLTQADRVKALRFGENAELYKANLVYAKGTSADAIELLKGGGKDVGLSVLNSNKKMFNNKVLNRVGKWAMRPLDTMDLAFSRPQYEHAYASWMTAKGFTAEDMTLRRRMEAQKYAVNEAQKATFRDANWLATKLTEIRDRNLFTELAVGGVLPFAKTPANILRRGVEYSPAGILQGFAQIYRADHDANLSQAERMQLRSTAIDKLASGTTGTGLLVIGMALRAMGVLRGKDDDDSRAAKFFKDMGRQPYSLQIGDYSMTLDWLAPMNMPMYMGVALYDAAETLAQGEDIGWKDVSEALLSIADPMIEMSMLQGLQSALKTYGSDNALSAVLSTAAQGYIGQFIPTILGQTARTADLTRRQPDSRQYWLQSMAAKIPGLSTIIKPYVGGYGEEETYEPTDSPVINYILRGVEQYALPGYIKVERRDELTNELARLYESTGVSKFLPQQPSDYRTLNLGKEYGTVDLTPEEQVEYEKLFRSEAAKALSEAIALPEYAGLSDADKADLLVEVYDAATKKARKQYKQTILERRQIGVAATSPDK